MPFMMVSKLISMARMISARIKEAIMTTIALFWSELQLGQVTLWTSSLYASFT